MSTKKRLLIVDDDSHLREALVRSFRIDGQYEVKDASNGMEALKLIREGFKPHVLLSDFDMPKCDGGALYEKLCEEFVSVSCHMIIMSGGFRGEKFANRHSIPFLSKPTERGSPQKEVDEMMSMVDEP